MKSSVFKDLAALRTQRKSQDRELAQIHQQLLDRGDETLLVDEADLQAIEEVLTAPSPCMASGNPGPAWPGARC